MKTLITLLILLIILLTITSQSTTDNKKELKVVFRYDDYSKYSNLYLETELFKIIRAKGGGILVGVIPYPYEPHPSSNGNFTKEVFLNNEKLALLKQYHENNTIEVAVHGFNHKNNEILDNRSEFSGLPEAEQEQILKISREKLENALGFTVTSFVPPFNNLDRNTLTALKNNGFTLLSAASTTSFYKTGDINYLPGGPYPNKLRSVIDLAVAKNHYDALIVSTQHPYDIKESGEEMPSFRKNKIQVSLADIKNDLNYIDTLKNIRVTSLENLKANNENLSADRLLANMYVRSSFVSKQKLLPDIFELYPLSGLYYSLEAANNIYTRQLIIASALYLIILLLTVIISKYLLSVFSNNIWLSRSIALVSSLLMGLALAKIYFGGLYFLSAMVITISIGLALSVSIQTQTKSTTG